VTTVIILLLLVAAFGSGRLFQWVRDAQGVLHPGGRQCKASRDEG
jgi:hypothetical protein